MKLAQPVTLNRQPKVELRAPWLWVRLPARCRSLSWAIVGSGFQWTRSVVWLQVSGQDLKPPVDPITFLTNRLRSIDLEDSVAMMTSRRIDRFVQRRHQEGAISADVVATVGLSNGVAVGDAAGYREPTPGTINIHCHVSTPLTDAALVEAISVVAEARTAAVLEASMRSPLSGRPVSGTGTDCVVVTCELSSDPPRAYAGKHGEVGAAIGRAVRDAVGEGCAVWHQDREQNCLAVPKEPQ